VDRGPEDAVTSRRRAIVPALALTVAVAVAAFLRFDELGVPSYWLDEILGQIVASETASMPWWGWLRGFHPQHGPLYYALQRVAIAFGIDEFTGRFFAALFGVAAVAAVWMAARLHARDWLFPGAAAFLLALSPLHVYYSREARPYALIVLLTVLAMVAILAHARVAAAVLFVLLLYTSVGAASAVAALALTAFVLASLDRDEGRKASLTAGVCGLVVLCGFPLLYRPTAEAVPGADFPGIDAGLLDDIVRGLSVTALGAPAGGRAAYALLALAVIGAASLWRRDRRIGLAFGAMTLLPAALAIAGLAAGNHFFAIRYVIPSLAGYLLLAGAGIAAIAATLARPAGRFAPFIAAALATVMIAGHASQTWSNARREAFRKLDWRAIAEALRPHLRRGDWIVAAEPWSDVSLRYYLGPIPRVAFAPLQGVGIAQLMVQHAPASWLVSAGYSSDGSIRSWMCGYPVLLSSGLENFRLHYAPSRGHFLAERSGPAEQRAVAAALGESSVRFELGVADELVLTSGWAAAEPLGADAFRWAVGRRAVLTFPRAEVRDRVIRVHAYPLHARQLPQQTARVVLNGREIANVTMPPQWRDYAFQAPAAFWRDGMNELAFEFGRATAPARLDPAMGDTRELAVSFQWIAIDDAGAPEARSAATVPSIRLAPDTLIDAGTAWRGTRTRFAAADLSPSGVQPLLARLGYEPRAVWPRLASGAVHIEDIAESAAYGTDCQDDPSFVRHLFALLLQREPSDVERRDLLKRLRGGATRVEIAHRVIRLNDFRRSVTRR
jgi:mannosyltransferase